MTGFESTRAPSWRGTEIAACAGVFLVIWIAGLLTLAPCCPHGDSGETAAVALTMGIAHPPGYPFPTLLGSLFAKIPGLGSVGWRTSLLSLAGAASAAVLVFAILRREFPLLPAAMPALLAVMAGLGLETWNQMTLPKGCVYTITAALLLLVVASGIAYGNRTGAAASGAGLAAGLGFGGHYMVLMPFLPFLAAPALKLIFERRLGARAAVLTAFFALMGVSVYLYIPLRTPSAHPALRWAEPVTAARFGWLVFRRQYLSIEKEAQAKEGMLMARRFALRFGEGYSFLSPLIFAAAVFLAWRVKRWWVLALAAGAAAEVLAAAFYPKLEEDALWVADPYFATGWTAIAAVMAWGIAHAAGIFGRRGTAAAWAAAVFLAGWAVICGAQKADKSRNYFASDGQADLAASLPPNCFFFCEGDANIAPLLYGLYVDGQRPDIRTIIPIFLHFRWGLEQLHEQYPDLRFRKLEPWDGVWQMAADIIQAHPERPAAYTLTTSKNWPFTPYAKPQGLYYLLLASDKVISDKKVDRALGRLRLRGLLSGELKHEPFGRVIRENLVGAFFRRGIWWFAAKDYDMALVNFERAIPFKSPEAALNAGMIYFNRGNGDRAGELWNKAREWAPGRPEPYVNLGLLALRRMHLDEAVLQCQKAIEINPGFAKAYEVLASAVYAKGKVEAALGYMEKAISLSPDDARLKKAAEAMRRGAVRRPKP